MTTENYAIGYEDGKRDGFNEGVDEGHKAATSRQEAKITNLLNALQSLSRQVERMRESGVVWDDVGPEQMAIEAIAAAKETS